MLLLPDFIVEKYPQWPLLERRGFFNQVRLFPYLRIPHGEESQTAALALAAYEQLDLPPLESFSKRYVAGAHFYFSLCLLERGLPFSFFEDAAGTLSHPQREAGILAERFPQHAAVAQGRGLFSGENPLIREVFCCGASRRRCRSLFGIFPWSGRCRLFPGPSAGEWCASFCPIPCGPGRTSFC